jgi:hypothetical protein
MRPATNYSYVQALLDEIVGGTSGSVGAHGAFWRSLSRDEFIQFQVFGQPVIAVDPKGAFDPEGSALIQSLEGRAPFGSDVGAPGGVFRRMPAGVPPMPADRIKIIRDWIANGCPP